MAFLFPFVHRHFDKSVLEGDEGEGRFQRVMQMSSRARVSLVVSTVVQREGVGVRGGFRSKIGERETQERYQPISKNGV